MSGINTFKKLPNVLELIYLLIYPPPLSQGQAVGQAGLNLLCAGGWPWTPNLLIATFPVLVMHHHVQCYVVLGTEARAPAC